MQVVGVSTGGARNVRSVTVAASDVRPPVNPSAAKQAENFSEEARIASETVVLPRTGRDIDHRNDQLRRQNAQHAYQAYGGDPPPAADRAPPKGL